MEAITRLYTIYRNGQRLGAEFATSEHDAVTRYSNGSLYTADQLTAIRGYKP